MKPNFLHPSSLAFFVVSCSCRIAATHLLCAYLRDKFYRLKARRGYKRAAVAIAHKILVFIYHMLSQNVSYNDLGDLYLDNLNKHHLTRNLVRRSSVLVIQ